MAKSGLPRRAFYALYVAAAY